MKAVVLKPIVWNTLNYQRPSGNVGSGGFPSEHGYGHEEWNNNDRRVWDEYRLFHTEAPETLRKYGEHGELGMLLIASNGPQYAVGIAVNVYFNDEALRATIADELGTYESWKELWDLPIVRDLKKGNKDRFFRHWDANYQWIAWRCPPECFFWFDEPIELNPVQLTGKKRLVSEYGTYQRIAPEQILNVVRNHLPAGCDIIRWLEDGNFDPEMLPPNFVPPRIPGAARKGGNRPTDKEYSYRILGKVLVEPRHSKLQERYVQFLRSQGFDPRENENYVDVIYEKDGQDIFVEIKPTDNLQSKYAIRFAVGQLLEYRYFQNRKAHLEIVLTSRPSDPNEIDFVRHLGITLTYFDTEQDTFISL